MQLSTCRKCVLTAWSLLCSVGCRKVSTVTATGRKTVKLSTHSVAESTHQWQNLTLVVSTYVDSQLCGIEGARILVSPNSVKSSTPFTNDMISAPPHMGDMVQLTQNATSGRNLRPTRDRQRRSSHSPTYRELRHVLKYTRRRKNLIPMPFSSDRGPTSQALEAERTYS